MRREAQLTAESTARGWDPMEEDWATPTDPGCPRIRNTVPDGRWDRKVDQEGRWRWREESAVWNLTKGQHPTPGPVRPGRINPWYMGTFNKTASRDSFKGPYQRGKSRFKERPKK